MSGDSFGTVGDTFKTVEVIQYSGYNISTVGDIFSTVEGKQYIGDTFSTCGVITSVKWGITSGLWRVFSTVGKIFNFDMFGH